MNFASLPDRRADLDPHGPAVSDARVSLTNAAFLQRVRAASSHLKRLGIGPGDVVALKLKNRVEFVVLLFAAWRLGATVTPINPTLTDGEVVWQLDSSGARLLVVEEGPAKAAGVTTLTELRMKAWPMPQSSAQTIGYVPSRSGVARTCVVIPGTTSSLAAKLGTQKEWMTSSERIEKRTGRPIGSSTRKVVPSPGRDVTPIVPPCASTMALTIVRPSPVPGTWSFSALFVR